jgi:hypothetical protein
MLFSFQKKTTKPLSAQNKIATLLSAMELIGITKETKINAQVS